MNKETTKPDLETALNRIARALEIIALSQAVQACRGFYSNNWSAGGRDTFGEIQSELMGLVAGFLKQPIKSCEVTK
jgi:hypothetical protein